MSSHFNIEKCLAAQGRFFGNEKFLAKKNFAPFFILLFAHISEKKSSVF